MKAAGAGSLAREARSTQPEVAYSPSVTPPGTLASTVWKEPDEPRNVRWARPSFFAVPSTVMTCRIPSARPMSSHPSAFSFWSDPTKSVSSGLWVVSATYSRAGFEAASSRIASSISLPKSEGMNMVHAFDAPRCSARYRAPSRVWS